MICSVVYGMQTVLLLLLARELGFGEGGYGYLLAGLGVGGILGTVVAGRADRSSHPRAVVVGALVVLAVPSALMAVLAWLPGLLVLAVVAGAGAVLVEVLCETALQRELDEEVFTRAYGIALPVSIAGIVVGSLIAAPLAMVVGLTGAIVGTGDPGRRLRRRRRPPQARRRPAPGSWLP